MLKLDSSILIITIAKAILHYCISDIFYALITQRITMKCCGTDKSQLSLDYADFYTNYRYPRHYKARF